MPRSGLVLLTAGVTAAVIFATGCEPSEEARAGTGPTPSPSASRTAPTASPSPTATPTPTPTATATPSPTETPRPKPILRVGDRGTKVRELQVRLAREDAYAAKIDGIYGPRTEQGVTDFQEARGLDPTGSVDQATWDRLVDRTGTVTEADLYPVHRASADSLDPRCLTGRVICANKSAREVSWVIDGVVQFTMDARFGRDSLPTANGTHQIAWKDIDHVSSLYDDAPMPFSMFFYDGQAVHYSPEFKAYGYGGPGGSHGCINTRDWDLTERLYSEASVGDRVVVYGEY